MTWAFWTRSTFEDEHGEFRWGTDDEGLAALTFAGLVERHGLVDRLIGHLEKYRQRLRDRMEALLRQENDISRRTTHGTATIVPKTNKLVRDELALMRWLDTNYPALIVQRPHPELLKSGTRYLPGFGVEGGSVFAANKDGEIVEIPGVAAESIEYLQVKIAREASE